LAVIDHHITNTGFGAVSWVDPTCAATCQMVTYLAEACGIPLTGALATCLLTGIVTDTLGFRTGNTTPDVLEAAMRLQRGGASLTDIVARTLDRLPFSTLRLWSLVLPTLQLADRVVWVTVSLEQLQAAGQSDREAKLSSVLASVVEADMSAVFTEKIGENGHPEVKCSFRAKPGFDVGTLALALGGGGHPAASGCTVAGTLDEGAGRVVPILQAARRQQAKEMSA
jgi:phosphoesterase RecJ-like protein